MTIRRENPVAFNAPEVETVTQYGVEFPDGSIEWEDIDEKGTHTFTPKWKTSNTTSYWIDPKHDGNTASRYWEKLSEDYRNFMKGRGVDAEIKRVKREIIWIVQTAVPAPPKQTP